MKFECSAEKPSSASKISPTSKHDCYLLSTNGLLFKSRSTLTHTGQKTAPFFALFGLKLLSMLHFRPQQVFFLGLHTQYRFTYL